MHIGYCSRLAGKRLSGCSDLHICQAQLILNDIHEKHISTKRDSVMNQHIHMRRLEGNVPKLPVRFCPASLPLLQRLVC